MAAWTQNYFKTTPLTWGNDDPFGYACLSIKKELVYNGFSAGVDITKQVIGSQASAAIMSFQEANGLIIDGVVGPNTAKVLYRKRAKAVEAQYKIPDDLVCKIKSLESANDPGAIGSVDPDDHGLVQINLHYHPAVTLEQAESGEFSLNYAGNTLAETFKNLKDWDATVAAWNIGSYWAQKWLSAGKPTNGNIYYATATQYVANVKKQTC